MRILVALVWVLASISHGMCATPPDLRVAGIQAQQRALRETLADRSGPDNPMSKARREKIMAQQDRLLGLIEGKASAQSRSAVGFEMDCITPVAFTISSRNSAGEPGVENMLGNMRRRL